MNKPTEPQYKYFAFISYNSHDMEWGKRLQRRLENYKMSATLCRERGWKRKPIKPVFFAPTDIQPRGLLAELQERLDAARNLIVVCSPHSAKSEWVGKEIEYFHQLGRTQNIYFFIVDGQPHSGDPATECFNPIAHKLGLPEILGANIHEKIFKWSWLNKERAYIQLISKLLNVEFDSIWQRHKRQLIAKVVSWSVGVLIVMLSLIGAYVMSQPIDVVVNWNETTYHNEALPPIKKTDLVFNLQDEVKKSVIVSLDSAVIIKNIPRQYFNKQVRVTADIKDYVKVDTTLDLSENILVNIRRNPHVYGDLRFQIWDEDANTVPNVDIKILDYETMSDTEGYVSMFIPLEQQRVKYQVQSSFKFRNDTITTPCGENDILIINQ